MMEGLVTQQSSMGSVLLRVVLSLALVAVLLYFLLKILRRQNELRLDQKSWIKIHDYYSLGMNRGVYLMEVMSKIYVVAMSEGNFQILHEMDLDDPEWEALKDELTQEKDKILPAIKGFFNRNLPNTDFRDLLSKQMQRSRRLSQKIKGEQSDDEK
ncbi:MAG: flagellar biosynthetic protein FliO [Peptococcaceae bacterium]|jgi:flagellar protein FliO/FliZ|nr:flagellar biosynthetic protein FliO [Peptococcaceae bacterium]